jgi:cell division transport system permease protein
VLKTLPLLLWELLPVLPVTAAVIGWLTAQATVRSWLAGLP